MENPSTEVRGWEPTVGRGPEWGTRRHRGLGSQPRLVSGRERSMRCTVVCRHFAAARQTQCHPIRCGFLAQNKRPRRWDICLTCSPPEFGLCPDDGNSIRTSAPSRHPKHLVGAGLTAQSLDSVPDGPRASEQSGGRLRGEPGVGSATWCRLSTQHLCGSALGSSFHRDPGPRPLAATAGLSAPFLLRPTH